MKRLFNPPGGTKPNLAPLSAAEVERRTTPSAFLRQIHDELGRPDWLVVGTALPALDDWPERITVRQYLVLVGNLVRHGPDPAYHIAYLKAGVPLFSGALDTALRTAPTLARAFTVIADHASPRPGFLRFVVRESRDWLELRFEPVLPLGAARGPVIEAPAVAFARMIGHYLGRPSTGSRMLLDYPPPAYADRLRQAIEAQVEFAAPCTALLIPKAIAERPNISFDSKLWEASIAMCADEQRRHPDEQLAQFHHAFDAILAERARVPRLAEIASQIGMSERTLIRRLQQAGLSYALYREEWMVPQMTRLLGDPSLTIEAIALRLGFADSPTFSRSFKRRYGMTPGAFRRSRRATG